jgi:hypothetical protein
MTEAELPPRLDRPEKAIGIIMYMLGDQVDEFAGKLLWHHCRDSRHCQGHTGLPDLIITGPHGLLFVEVKPHHGSRLRSGQTSWRYMLEAVGARHQVWTTADLDDGTIRKELRALL